MRSLGLFVCVAAVTAVVAAPALADANTVDATCNGGSCAPWFNTSVAVAWQFAPTDPDSKSADCTDQTISDEGHHALDCSATWDAGPETVDHSIDVKIDLTPPTFTVSPGPDLNGWYNHPVTLSVSDSNDNLSGIDTCSDPPSPYSGPDGAGVNAGGGCTDKAGNATPVLINYDATPPLVTGATADRPPDHDGWFNHPVAFTFHGTDGASSVASCSSASYSGPDDGSASVGGSCTDVAGNTGQGSQTFRYDSTRPAPASVQVTPGNHRITLDWTVPADVTGVSVTRSQKDGSAAPKLIYSGNRRSIIDKGLNNGTKYTYSVTDSDPAGNSSGKLVRAIPTGSSLRPFVGTVVSSPPLLTWKKIKGARYYNVQLFFGKKKVLSIWPRNPSLQLAASWHFNGKAYTLVPGHYRWYVWPGFGSLSQHRYGHRIGRSSFRVVGGAPVP